MGKRGRKPSPNSPKKYFMTEQEEAVLEYLSSEDKFEKDKIYNTKLKYAFERMVESIIRRYKLYIPNETFEETFTDTISFLMTKLDKFKPGKHKAYSYYGTICKNHLIARLQEYTKNTSKYTPYEPISANFIDSIKYSDANAGAKKIYEDTVTLLAKKIGRMIEQPEEYKLKDAEVKVGIALKKLLENWDFVLSTDGSNKLNKNTILFFLRESTDLDTKTIRENLKKYKTVFLEIKKYLVS